MPRFREKPVIIEAVQWIIRGVQGEFYPCDDNVLRATYEEV